MRRLLLSSCLLLLCSSAAAQDMPDPGLLITTSSDEGVRLEYVEAGDDDSLTFSTTGGVVFGEAEAGASRSILLKGREVSVRLPKGTSVTVDDLNAESPSGRIDWEAGTIMFAGDLALEVKKERRILGRMVVREARVTYRGATGGAGRGQ